MIHNDRHEFFLPLLIKQTTPGIIKKLPLLIKQMTLGILPLLIQQTTVIMIEIEYNGFGLASSCNHKSSCESSFCREWAMICVQDATKRVQKGSATGHSGNTMGHVISDALKLLVKGWEVLSIQSYMRFESNHLTHMG